MSHNKVINTITSRQTPHFDQQVIFWTKQQHHISFFTEKQQLRKATADSNKCNVYWMYFFYFWHDACIVLRNCQFLQFDVEAKFQDTLFILTNIMQSVKFQTNAYNSYTEQNISILSCYLTNIYRHLHMSKLKCFQHLHFPKNHLHENHFRALVAILSFSLTLIFKLLIKRQTKT